LFYPDGCQKLTRERRLRKKEIIDHGFREEYIVTFEDGTVDSAFRSKTLLTASRYPRYYDFIIHGKEGDVWEGESDDDQEMLPVPPGHNTSVRGDEPCICIDFSGIEEYINRRVIKWTVR
jgi:hypothetical protein